MESFDTTRWFKVKRALAVVLAMMMLLSACAFAEEAASVFEAFTGARVAVQTGTISGEVAQGVIPDIELDYYNSQIDAMTALRTGKADAWATDEPVARFMMIENPDLKILGNLDESSLAQVFPKTEEGQALRDRFSAFVEGRCRTTPPSPGRTAH